MNLSTPDKSGAASLEAIARNGSLLRRIAVRIPTYLKDMRENPAWLPMFMLARTMPARKLHWLGAKAARPAQSAGATMFKGVELNSIVETLLSGHYFERILGCKAALAIQSDPLLLDIAQHYLGGQAKLITTRVWWSFPTGEASDADKNLASLGKYHFDLDDWRMLKFFFYLKPCDAGTGPHVYVRGSHNMRSVKHQLTLLVGHPAEEVLKVYGDDSPVTLTGEAGLGFVEDPFGFHMGTVPSRTPRLMMEVGFGVSPPSRRRFHGEPVIR